MNDNDSWSSFRVALIAALWVIAINLQCIYSAIESHH